MMLVSQSPWIPIGFDPYLAHAAFDSVLFCAVDFRQLRQPFAQLDQVGVALLPVTQQVEDIHHIVKPIHNSPSVSWAASLMHCWLQGGSHTSSTEASLTPGTLSTAVLTCPGSVPATGQDGAVSVI